MLGVWVIDPGAARFSAMQMTPSTGLPQKAQQAIDAERQGNSDCR